MRARAAGWTLALAIAVGATLGAASCTGGPTVEEVCAVVCECFTVGPIEQAQCQSQCPGQIGGLPVECMQCIVDTDECADLESTCDAVCQVPMP
jgi:hypothetical protein